MSRPPLGRPTRHDHRPAVPGPRWPRPSRSLAVAALFAAAVIAFGGCGGTDAERRLTIFAASSLRDVFDPLVVAYEADHPGVSVVVATDASSTLRVQIEQGAPADVFAPASPDEIAALEAAGLIAAEPVAFATARVVLAAPVTGSSVMDPWDLAAPGTRVVLAAPDVPIARYAADVMRRLEASPDAPPEFADRVRANVVSEEANVRSVLAKLELGEADAGFVYGPDVLGRPAVRVVPLPDDAAVVADYQAVALAGARDGGLAADFVAWLGGPDARGILAGSGFGVPG